MQGVPSGWQASWQVPPMHVPLQQFCPVAHIPPLLVQDPQFAPQRLSASWTQIASQVCVQQTLSAAHTEAAHALHIGSSGGPTSQTPWLHVAWPHTFWTHDMPQQSEGPLHGTPSSEHFGSQIPSLQLPLQHSASLKHLPPFGWQGPAHTPPEQIPVQQSFAPLQREPAGKQPPQMPPLQLALQQSPVVSQPKPFGAQGGLHSPAMQLPVQHCAAVAHAEPSGKQPLMHSPPAHESEQHWLESVHADPVPMQLAAHVPAGPHTPLQHSGD